jgi:trehalose/maltose hydrolase-like predicted phosphorylase
MAAWMFTVARDLLDLLPNKDLERLMKDINITPEDINRWDDLTKKIAIPLSSDGILEQFAGYFDLEELDWDHYKNTYQDIHRMDRILKSEGRSPNNYKVAKQADTLMAFYNLSEKEICSVLTHLGYDPPPDMLERNLHYYLQRTSHGSTLSRLVHAYLAHQVNNFELSWKLYQEALRSDYLDIQGGTTQEGIHLGVMTGTILFAYRAYAGLDWSGDILKIAPRLPTDWQEMSFSLNYRDGIYHFLLTPDQVKVKFDHNIKGSIMIYDQIIELLPGKWVDTTAMR